MRFFLLACFILELHAYAGNILQYETSEEHQVRILREHEIAEVQAVLSRKKARVDRADLQFRLAEIYLELYHQYFILEGRDFESQIKGGRKGGKIDRKFSKYYLKKGIEASKQVQALNPSFSKMDQVYYFLGFNFTELGNEEQGASYFRTLVKKYPRSTFTSESYRELGLLAMKRNQFGEAERNLQAALQTAKSKDDPYLLHKLAWVYYRTRKTSQAISTLKQAIAVASENQDRFLSVRDEAVRDLVIFLAEQGRVDEAISYFKGQAKSDQDFAESMDQLAKEFDHGGQDLRAIKVYEAILKSKPNEALRYQTLARLVELDLKIRAVERATSRLNAQSFPDAENDISDENVRVAYRNLKAVVRRSATENHERYRKLSKRKYLTKAQREDQQEALKNAAALYSAYLNQFLIHSSQPEKAEVMMYLAELQSEQGRPELAVQTYKQVLKSHDQRFASEAAVLWIAELEKTLRNMKSRPTGATAPTSVERDFVIAADELEQELPDSREAREASLRAAQLLAGYSSTRKEALEHAEKVSEKYAGSPQGHTAALLRLQILMDLQSEDLADAIQEIRGNEQLMSYDAKSGKGELKDKLDRFGRNALVSSIAESEKSGEYNEAAEKYEDFVRSAKDPASKEKAYDSAVINYLKARDWGNVYRLGNQWVTEFPRSKQAITRYREIATNLLIMGEFKESAAAFSHLFDLTRETPSLKVATALWSAVGEKSRAESDRRRLLAVLGKSSEAARVILDLGRQLAQDGRGEEAAPLYSRCWEWRVLESAECAARQADIAVARGETYVANRQFQSIAASKSASPFVAYARYRLAESLEKEITAHKTPLTQDGLKQQLPKRLNDFKRVNQAYRNVAEAGGPWGVAALYRLAVYVYIFAGEIDTLPNTKAISDPLRSQAKEILEQAYEKSLRGELLSSALPQLTDLMVSQGSARIARAQGARENLRLMGEPNEQAREKLFQNPKLATAWVDYGNYLWARGAPGVAKIAYDRATELDPRNVAAIQNRAVMWVSEGLIENPQEATEALSGLKRARSMAPSEPVIAANLGVIYNYYRLFRLAKNQWDLLITRSPSAVAYDGLAVASQGLGNFSDAARFLGLAEKYGASSDRFVRRFYSAVEKSRLGSDGKSDCLDELDDVEKKDLAGFPAIAVENLRKVCQ